MGNLLRLLALLFLSPPFHATPTVSVTESVSITDSVTSRMAFGRSISATITVTDTLVFEDDKFGLMGSVITLADSVTAHKIVTATFSDSLILSDNPTKIQPFSLISNINLSTNLSALKLSETSEKLCISDNFVLNLVLRRDLISLFQVSDSATAYINNRLTVQDFGLVSTKMQLHGLPSQDIEDSLNIVDDANIPIDYETDSLNITDSVEFEIQRCQS